MKKLLIISLAIVAMGSAARAEQKQYIIEKVNKGTHFLKPGQELAGYLDSNEVCGAEKGTGMGAPACAVVTPAGETAETHYYLNEVYVTGTPAKNLVGFIEGSVKKGTGIGGDKATGVFKEMH